VIAAPSSTEQSPPGFVGAPEVIDVVIVADTAVLAELVDRVVSAEASLRCVAAGHRVGDVLRGADESDPVVALIFGAEPEDAISELRSRWPLAHVVVVSSIADTARSVDLVRAGASAILSNDTGLFDVLKTVRDIGSGVVVLDVSVLNAVRARLRAPKIESRLGMLKITPREREVLAMLGEGKTQSAIATKMCISIHTCRGHVKSLMQKIGVHSQVELAVFAADAVPADRPGERYAS
jgi:DNA-binding NarL/FixJ family response regulator